jgi:hypothetical protein
MLPTLPDDVLVRMFEYCDTSSDAFTACQVSKHWNSLLRSRCPWLWRTMRVEATHNVCWDTTIVTRSKRKRYTVFLAPLFASKGTLLHKLTLGTPHHLCDILLTTDHLSSIAAACPNLHTLKLYVTDVMPDLPMSALNQLVTSCSRLTNLAMPVNGATTVTDELPVKYMGIHKLRLHGDLTVRSDCPTQVWLGASLTTLQLVDVCDLDQSLPELELLQNCTQLKHLIIHNCTSRVGHPMHLAEAINDVHSWVFQLACRLETLGVVRSSSFVCTASLLNSLTAFSTTTNTGADTPVPWSNLRNLWLDALIFPGDNYQTECLFSCLDCTRYFIYKRTTATEIIRCMECQQQKFVKLEAVYLVD